MYNRTNLLTTTSASSCSENSEYLGVTLDRYLFNHHVKSKLGLSQALHHLSLYPSLTRSTLTLHQYGGLSIQNQTRITSILNTSSCYVPNHVIRPSLQDRPPYPNLCNLHHSNQGPPEYKLTRPRSKPFLLSSHTSVTMHAVYFRCCTIVWSVTAVSLYLHSVPTNIDLPPGRTLPSEYLPYDNKYTQ